MFVKSNVGLCVRESGRSVSAIVGVSPIVPERAPVPKEQSANLLTGETAHNAGVVNTSVVYGMFASLIFDLLTSGKNVKALWFEIEGEISRGYLLREYIEHPGPIGELSLIRDSQFNCPEIEEMRVTDGRDTFELEVFSSYGALTLTHTYVIPVPYAIRTGRGLTPTEREQALLRYVSKHPPLTQPIQTLCSLRQEPATLTKVRRYYEAAKYEGVTMYYIS